MSNTENKISDSALNRVLVTGAIEIAIGTTLGLSPESKVINKQVFNIVGNVIHEASKKAKLWGEKILSPRLRAKSAG